MLLRCLKAEIRKCRRSPVWLAFLILPIFPAILGTGNYLANQEVLENGWYSLWSQHTLFSPPSSCPLCWACSVAGSGGWNTPITTGTAFSPLRYRCVICMRPS